MKRFLSIALAALVLTVSLAGCANTKLAESFDRDAVTAAAKRTVEVINTLDYDAVVALGNADIQSAITADKLKQGWDDKLSKLGDFVDYSSVTVIGSKSGGKDYAVAIVNAKYKDGSAIYTLSFDTDMKLAGMYMK